MIRTLFIIAGAALVLSVACLSGATALGGRDLARHGWSWTFHDENGESVRFERVHGGGSEDLGPIVERTVAWTGGQTLQIDSSIDVEYRQGTGSTVLIRGPKGLADRVRLQDSRLFLADGDERVVFGWNSGHLSARSERDELHVVVTTPDLNRFTVRGSGHLSLIDYDQPSLAIDMSGSGEVQAAGRTESLDLAITGSGDADLSDLQTRDAKIDVSGSGDVRAAPTAEAHIGISGSGDVDLTTRPSVVTSDISGSGDLSQP